MLWIHECKFKFTFRFLCIELNQSHLGIFSLKHFKALITLGHWKKHLTADSGIEGSTPATARDQKNLPEKNFFITLPKITSFLKWSQDGEYTNSNPSSLSGFSAGSWPQPTWETFHSSTFRLSGPGHNTFYGCKLLLQHCKLVHLSLSATSSLV